MTLGRFFTTCALTVTVVFAATSSSEARSLLNEKSIVKKLIFKKKVRRAPARKTTVRRRGETRSITRYKKVKRTTRRKKRIQFVIEQRRAERRSRIRRKALRRILTAKRRASSRKKKPRYSSRRISFPRPGIEIIDNPSKGIKVPGGARSKPKRPSRTRPSRKWAKSPTRNARIRKNVWRKKGSKPAVTYSQGREGYTEQPVQRPTRVATTRFERQQIQEIVDTEDLPQIDIEIYFDYNSATIRSRSMPDVGVLGRALRNRQLAGSQFMIIGHTDATGGDAYNLRLSEDRANAVRNFLVNVFGLEGERFFPMGYGEEQLKPNTRPDHPENRRVQIVNIGNRLQ